MTNSLIILLLIIASCHVSQIAPSRRNIFWLENFYYKKVLDQHRARYLKSFAYLSKLPNTTLNRNNRDPQVDDNITAYFISFKRRETGFEYLYQSVASLHYSLQKVHIQASFIVAFCGNETDAFLQSKFPSIHIPSPDEFPNDMCMSKSASGKLECMERYHMIEILKHTRVYAPYGTLLLLQDDAVAREYAGYHIKWLLEHRLPLIRYNKPPIIKLFSPPHMHKYPIKFHDICELLAFLYILNVASRYLFGLHYSTCLLICIFACFVCIIGGRQILFEPRRILPWLYTLKPSYQCCIPAVMFTRPNETLPPMIEYLKKPNSWQVDVVMSKYCLSNGVSDMTLEPNIFEHVGFESSLYHHKSLKPFVNLLPSKFLGS